jgi:LacI family transcriptional regulator
MRAICEHLWERGYRRPGYMSGERGPATALRRQSEFEGFWAARGVAPLTVLPARAYERAAAGEAMAHYLSATAADNRIDVLMCENDVLAIGAMDTARSTFGLAVPRDLAFVGYDGIDFTGSPSYDLTTYEQPLDAMITRMIAMITGRAPRQSSTMEGRLIVRGSTAAKRG